jgi:dTDP-4-amino-4,6-dideoxygalactose transaminase
LQADTPNAEKLANSALTLPNHPLVTSTDISRIAKILSDELHTLPKEPKSSEEPQ